MSEVLLLPAGRQSTLSPQFDLQGRFFQAARLVDVILLGPFMIWFALRSTQAPDWARIVLAASGVLTIGFNLRSYVLVNRVRGEDATAGLLR